jgi:HNH endonuclease
VTSETILQRFWEKVEVPISRGKCWRWTATILRDGYGQFRLNGKLIKPHRLAYELLVGPIPDGMMTLDHVCRNRACVNPYHLEPATNRDNNVLRGIGISATNARKTHCPKGHPLSGDNLYHSQLKKGWRECRICAT